MITLQAFQTTTFLPNPEWDDSENLTVEVITKRSMNGILYTYAKTKNERRRLLMRFKLTRAKAFELRAFIHSYFSSEIKLVDHIGQTWIGNLMNNPFEFESVVGEGQEIQLEFEGIKQ